MTISTSNIAKRLGQRVGHLTPLIGVNALLDASLTGCISTRVRALSHHARAPRPRRKFSAWHTANRGASAPARKPQSPAVFPPGITLTRKMEVERKKIRKPRAVRYFAFLATVALLAASCATSVKTTLRNDSELARIESFSVVEVGELRDSAIISRALVTGLREKGFTVEKAGAADVDSLGDMGLKLGVDGIIYGYVTRIEQRSFVTDGEERIRTRKTAHGTKETIRYDPPEVITKKTIYVRLKALDGLNGYVIWDAEGQTSGDIGSDTVYMIESLVTRMLQELPAPPTESTVASEPTGPETIAVGRRAPDFTTRSVGGERISLSDYAGKKVVVLNFWGTRCLPCLQEMPKLESIYSRYKDRGMEMLGVNVDGVDADFIKRNLRKRIGDIELNVTYPLLLDEEFEILDAYYLTVAPLTIVIDKKGIIRYLHIDYQPGDEIELESVVKRILEQG